VDNKNRELSKTNFGRELHRSYMAGTLETVGSKSIKCGLVDRMKAQRGVERQSGLIGG
jgi:hypothetical protein